MAGWWVIGWLRPAWTQGVMYWVRDVPRMYQWQLGLASGIVLVVLLAWLLWTVHGPRRSRKADSAMGLGCLMMFSWGLMGVIVVLGIGMAFGISWIVMTVAYGTLLPVAFILPQVAWALMGGRRKRRRRR